MRLSRRGTSRKSRGFNTPLTFSLEGQAELSSPNLILDPNRELFPSGIESSAQVGTVPPPVGYDPGDYVPLVYRDPNTWASDAAMKAELSFAVEGNLGLQRGVITGHDLVEWSNDSAYNINGTPVIRYLGRVSTDLEKYQFRALNTGAAGNDIVVIVTAGTTSNRKFTVQDHPTTPTVTETFDNIGKGTINNPPFSSSTLIEFIGWSSVGNCPLGTYTFSGGGVGVKATSAQIVANEPGIGGRVPIQQLNLTSIPGYPFGNIWVHWFQRFSVDWTSENSAVSAFASGADYKMVFARYTNGARHEIKFGTTSRGMEHKGSEGNLVNGTPTVIAAPWVDWETVNAQYNSSGYPGYSAYQSPTKYPGGFKPFRCTARPNNTLVFGDGDNEVYEFALHHNTSFTETVGVFAIHARRYTTGGVVDPGPWTHGGYYVSFPVPPTKNRVNKIEFGVNRNLRHGHDMSFGWGLMEVINGDVYADPLGISVGIDRTLP